MPLYNPPGSGAHPDLATHDTLGLATDAELTTHDADTTAVHGITDTSALSLDTHDHDADYEATGAVATHAGLADPHTGYQKESEKSAVSGYASLDAGTKVPIAELPTGTSGTTVALGDAAAGLITTHEGAANPHPTYETAAEVLAQIGTHEGLANPHPGYLTPAEGDAAYQPLDSDLTAIAALTTTAFGRGLLALADAAALGANHTHAGGADPFQGSYAPGSFTVPTGDYAHIVQRLILTGTERVTLEGTAQLRLD